MEIDEQSLTPAQITYSAGQCHELAIALHRNLGWELVVATDPLEFYWEDPEDCDNGIPNVFHVYAVDPQHNAWDIFGARPAGNIREDVQDRFIVNEVDTEWMISESEMATFVGDGEGEDAIDRPLSAYDDKSIDQAWVIAQEVLGQHPLWNKVRTTRASAPRP